MSNYLGEMHHLPGAPGQVKVKNKDRERRPRPGPNDQCPFAGVIQAGAFVRVDGFPGYGRFANTNPLVPGQEVILPLQFRTTPTSEDIALMVALVESGSAAYFNSRGAGQSIAHLHINSVPGAHVLLPVASPAPWAVCAGVGPSSVRRLEGLPFYALTACSSSVEARADTVAALVGHLARNDTPFNILAWRSRIAAAAAIAVVPRTVELSQTAGQRLAGLELLTGVILPGSSVSDSDCPFDFQSFTVHDRDRAFQEVTLNHETILALEHELHSEFGSPASGLAVMANG